MKKYSVPGLALMIGLTLNTASLQATSLIQTTIGSGCSSVCINNQCTSTCGDGQVRKLEDAGPPVSKNIDITDFDSLVVTGVNIKLFQSDDYSITLNTAENVVDKLAFEKQQNTLTISPLANTVINAAADVLIGLPTLQSLVRTGTGTVTLNGFNQSSLELDLSGTGEVVGQDNDIKNLNVNATGTVGLDLTQSQVTNAQVMAQGVNKIALRFEDSDGSLSGQLNGVSTVSYCGEPDNSITVQGVSRTQKIECL